MASIPKLSTQVKPLYMRFFFHITRPLVNLCKIFDKACINIVIIFGLVTWNNKLNDVYLDVWPAEQF